MDAKGRLFFPAEYRRQLDGVGARFVLKRDVYQPCLVIYPFQTWEADINLLRARVNRWQPQEAALLREFLSNVEEVQLDANRRLLVPRRFWALLGAERKVCFVGLDDRIELWDAARAEQPFMQPEELSDVLQRIMATGQ